MPTSWSTRGSSLAVVVGVLALAGFLFALYARPAEAQRKNSGNVAAATGRVEPFVHGDMMDLAGAGKDPSFKLKVPMGKLLVIEYLSCRVRSLDKARNLANVRASIQIQSQTGVGFFALPMVRDVSSNLPGAQFSQPVMLRTPGEATLFLNFDEKPEQGMADYAVSGYLLDNSQ